MSTFELETRYVVIKLKHLTDTQHNRLCQVLDDEGIGTIDCIVVEADWPEYQPTLDAIKTRCEASE